MSRTEELKLEIEKLRLEVEKLRLEVQKLQPVYYPQYEPIPYWLRPDFRLTEPYYQEPTTPYTTPYTVPHTWCSGGVI